MGLMSEYLYVKYSSKESNSITATIKFSEEEIMSTLNKILDWKWFSFLRNLSLLMGLLLSSTIVGAAIVIISLIGGAIITPFINLWVFYLLLDKKELGRKIIVFGKALLFFGIASIVTVIIITVFKWWVGV